MPLTIDVLALDALVVPNTGVTVAVVPVDWSGNAHLDNLVTSTAIAINDGIEDVGAYLPDIEGITLEWVKKTFWFWEHTTDSNVRNYLVYISSDEFSNVADATNVGSESTSSSFLITSELFTDLSSDSEWWIGVAAKDDVNSRKVIESARIGPLDSSDGDGGGDSGGDDSTVELGELLTTDNLIIAGMILISYSC